MATPAAILSILVEANTTAANAGLARTNAELTAAGRNAGTTTKTVSRAGTALHKLGTVAKYGAAAGLAAFVYEAKKSVETTQDITKTTLNLHKSFGMGVKTSSEWASALRARGADATKAGMAFKTFATQLRGANDGSAASVAMFKKLGFSQADIQKSMTNTQYGLKLVADGLDKLPGGANKAAIAGTLFGRGWQTIAPMLRDGSAAMQQNLDTTEKYGAYLDQKGFKQQKELMFNLRDNKIAWQGLQIQLAQFVTPALNKVSDQFQKVARIMASKKLTEDQKFSKVAAIIEKDMGKALDFVLKLIPQIASKVGERVPQVAGAFVKGFLDANVWGKLLIGSWLITKLGGWGVIGSLGGRVGSRLGGAMARTTVEQTMLAEGTSIPSQMAARGRWTALGSRIGAWLGPAVAAAAVPILLIEYRRQITDFFHSRGFTLPGETVPGNAQSPLNNPTSVPGMLGIGGGQGRAVLSDTAKQAMAGLRVFTRMAMKQYGTITAGTDHFAATWREDWTNNLNVLRDKGNLSEKQLRLLQGVIDGTTGDSSKSMKKLAHVLGISLKNVDDSSDKSRSNWSKNQKSVQRDADQTTRKVSGAASDMAGKVSKSYGNMAKGAADGMRLLQTNTNKALSALGVKQALNFIAKHQTLQGQPGHHQRGGHISGVGSGDTVPAMLEPGEFVMNREAVRGIGRARLEAMNRAIPRFAKGGSVQNGLDFALGPYTVPPIQYAADHAGANSHVHISAFSIPWLLSVGHKIQQMGNSVGEFKPTGFGNPYHFGPITTSAHAHYPTDHYSGHAVDVNSLRGPENRAWEARIAAVLKGGGVAGAVAEKIARVILTGPKGPLRDMGQAALDKVRSAANKYIAKHAPTMRTDPGVGKGAYNMSSLESLWRATGRNGDPHLMAAIAMAESGGNPRADNGIARGLWQIISSTWSAYGKGSWGNAFNPTMNAQAAHRILEGSGLQAWDAYTNGAYRQFMQQGGMVPWFGKGADFIANNPQLIGVGDGGPERVRVTPLGGRDQPPGPPVVNVDVQHSYAPGMEWLGDFVESYVDVAIEEYDNHRANVGGFG